MTNNTQKQRYSLHLLTPNTGLIIAAEVVIEERNYQPTRLGFRYTQEYLDHPSAFALDPVQLQLTHHEIILTCNGGVPGLLDDYLPDDWGRRVLTRLAYYRNQKSISAHSSIDILAQLNTSRIGAIQWTLKDELPDFGLGCHTSAMVNAEIAAQAVDEPDEFAGHLDEMSLLYLANAGTGIGGSRPKALLFNNDNGYVAKFNRLRADQYNNARVELACLYMAQAAGIHILDGFVENGINGRDVLLLNRFDLVLDQSTTPIPRKHVISINALLKEQMSQRDRGGVFRYDDIADIVRRYSVHVEEDLKQLLLSMLFNAAVHNIDDHERNFSLINDGRGYRLAPAYDMVPSLEMGAYHVAGYGLKQNPPTPKLAQSEGKIFGLSKPVVNNISNQVIQAIENWPTFAEKAGVIDSEIIRLKNIFKL